MEMCATAAVAAQQAEPLAHRQTTGMPNAAPTASAAQWITAATLRRALLAGIRRVRGLRDELNRINVFPVPDGDTGSNLAATLGHVVHTALEPRSHHAGALLVGVGDAAIDGARGNSGAIMAQFLVGMAEPVRRLSRLDVGALALAFRGGADSARAALARPVEGTVLSVITACAEALEDLARRGESSVRTAYDALLQAARAALARTPQQLAVLQKAGVVDAGARGFVEWLEGMAAGFTPGAQGAARERETVRTEPLVHVHEDVDPLHRYCTECLVSGDRLQLAELRRALSALDVESLVVAGGGARVRVHGHVASPQHLFDGCAAFGDVAAMKADDMLMQQRSVESPDKVAIVTDSAADLPAALADRFDIHIVPVRVSLDGRDYLDRLGLTAAEFYRRMALGTQLPHTSQPPVGDFRRVFEQVLAHQPAGVYVGLSRPLSGTLQAGESAARAQLKSMRCVDSGHVSVGQALLAWRAGELAHAGAGVPAIEAELQRLTPLTMTWALARDISHAVRGGRIPRWAAPLVRYSGLTPMACIKPDGRLAVTGGLFARRNAPGAFARHLARRVSPLVSWRVIVGHAAAAEDAERLLSALHQRLAITEAYLVEVGPAIGAHAGPGTLLVGMQPAPTPVSATPA